MEDINIKTQISEEDYKKSFLAINGSRAFKVKEIYYSIILIVFGAFRLKTSILMGTLAIVCGLILMIYFFEKYKKNCKKRINDIIKHQKETIGKTGFNREITFSNTEINSKELNSNHKYTTFYENFKTIYIIDNIIVFLESNGINGFQIMRKDIPNEDLFFNLIKDKCPNIKKKVIKYNIIK